MIVTSRHRRHIGTTGGTGPHHDRDLRYALAAHPRLIVKNRAKVIAVGKDLILIGQVRATLIHEIDAGQMVFLGDLLRAQVLFDGHREIGATLHRRIVADDHAPHGPATVTNARDHAGTRARRRHTGHAPPSRRPQERASPDQADWRRGRAAAFCRALMARTGGFSPAQGRFSRSLCDLREGLSCAATLACKLGRAAALCWLTS